MYTDPSVYKQRRLEAEAAQEAEHVASLKDPETVKRHYDDLASKEAEERLKYTEPLTYQRKQLEKEKAALRAEQARMEDVEYLQLKSQVDEARQ